MKDNKTATPDIIFFYFMSLQEELALRIKKMLILFLKA